MRSIRMIAPPALIAATLLMTGVVQGQYVAQPLVPLGAALDRAFERSLLTDAGTYGFHLKVDLREPSSLNSDYRAGIEEYWVSPRQWRRSIDSPHFKQILVVNGDARSEQDTGDYYPLWLKDFITGIFDPVPNAGQWKPLSPMVAQLNLPNGQRSDACARIKLRIGSDTVQTDAFGDVCFDIDGRLKFVASPGYNMELYDYQQFGNKMIARSYHEAPEPGIDIVGRVTVLEKLEKPDASLFSVVQPAISEPEIRSIRAAQSTIEQAAQGQPPLKWPPVPSGKTEGLLSIYISTDREGQIREAYLLNSDNPELQASARDQLLKWKLKPMTMSGTPVQAEAAVLFRFKTTLSNPVRPDAGTISPEASAPSSFMPGLVEALLISHGKLGRPAVARNHIQGKVELSLVIAKDGSVREIRTLSSPDQSLTDSAIAFVNQFRYSPYLLNGTPVDVESKVEVNFEQQEEIH